MITIPAWAGRRTQEVSSNINWVNKTTFCGPSAFIALGGRKREERGERREERERYERFGENRHAARAEGIVN